MERLFFIKMGIPMSLGICLAYRVDGLFTRDISGYTLFILMAAFAVGGICYKRLPMHRYRTILAFLAYSLYFYGGVWLCMLQKSPELPDNSKTRPYKPIHIRIIDEPQQKVKSVRCKAINLSEKATRFPYQHETILVTIYHDTAQSPRLNYGDELVINAKLKWIGPAQPGRYDLQYWMAVQHIYRRADLDAKRFIKVAANQGNVITAYALQLRKTQVERLNALISNQEAAAVAVTLILGYRADLDTKTLSAYATTGTIHALSVSGMHVGLIYLLLDKILFVFDRRNWSKLIKYLVILLSIWFYAMLTGFSPAVLRSALMLSVMVTANALRKTSSGLNMLAFSGCCLLVSDPFILFDMGFQLSYLSVFGLLTIQPLIKKWIRVERSLLRLLWDAIALSLSAQLFTFPLALYYFHQFPLYFLISNLLIAIPVSLMMYLGLLILILRLNFLALPLEWIIITTNDILRWISGLPFASISGVFINSMQLYCLYAAICLLTLAFVKFHTKLLLAGLVCLLLFSVARLKQTITTNNYPFVYHFLNSS